MTALTYIPGDLDSAASAKTEAKTAKKNRVQLDFAPRSMERLNALKEKTEASSYAEVVKNALRLYEALIEESEAGKQFLTRDQNGTVAAFRLFL